MNGKKSYIIMIATLAYAIGGMIIGNMDYSIGIPLVLGALGLGSARHAIKKLEK